MTFCLAEKYRLGKYGNARLEVKKGRFGLTYKNLEERRKRLFLFSLEEKVFSAVCPLKRDSFSVTEVHLLSTVAFAMCVTNCEKITTDLKNGFRNGKPLKTLVVFHLILFSISISIFIVSLLYKIWNGIETKCKIKTFQIYVDCRPVQDAPSVFVVCACLFFFLAACTGIAMSFIHQFWA